MVDVVIKPYYALPCHAEVFTINGKPADTEYFGSNEDVEPCAPWLIDPYSCGCNKFIPSTDPENKKKAMEIYNITEEDYYYIQDELSVALYVGGCGWCV